MKRYADTFINIYTLNQTQMQLGGLGITKAILDAQKQLLKQGLDVLSSDPVLNAAHELARHTFLTAEEGSKGDLILQQLMLDERFNSFVRVQKRPMVLDGNGDPVEECYEIFCDKAGYLAFIELTESSHLASLHEYNCSERETGTVFDTLKVGDRVKIQEGIFRVDMKFDLVKVAEAS